MPGTGGDSLFYGQISRPGATLQLTETNYEASTGATVDIWITGLDDYREELLAISEPTDAPAHAHLPRWSRRSA